MKERKAMAKCQENIINERLATDISISIVLFDQENRSSQEHTGHSNE
jgi:hypothetical protein